MGLRRNFFALLMGGFVATFVNGYLLDDGFALQSRSVSAVTAFATGMGIVAAWFLYPWVERQWQGSLPAQRWKLLLTSLFLGSLLLFGGTSQWLEESRYLRFLLPIQHFQLSVSTSSPGSVKVIWFTTALGDVSFKEVEKHGWQRKEDILVLTSPNENALEWQGKVGRWVKIVFESKEETRALLSWNGYSETIELPRGRYVYTKSFPVPFMIANGRFVLGWVPVVVFTAIALLWVWQYREKWIEEISESLRSNPPFAHWEWGFLLGIIFFAFLLRIGNLKAPPYVDELGQLVAARDLAEGNAPEYRRSFWVVTVPVALALRFLGSEIWMARIPGVLFSVLALVPLYLLARRIHRVVAVVAALLYATNPFIIVFSRLIREYSYYPFYFYWITYGLLVFLDSLPPGFSIWKDGKRLFNSRMGLVTCSLLWPVGYAFYDNLSTFKLIFLSYLAFGLLVLAKLDYKDKRNRILVTIFTVFGIAAAYWLLPRQLAGFELTLNPLVLTLFFLNPPQQWYFQRGAILAILVFAVLFYFIILERKSKKIDKFTFIFVNYFLYLTFFLLANKPARSMRPRHMVVSEMWFIILVATGMWLIWMLIRTSSRTKVLSLGLAGVLLFLSFNPVHIFATAVAQDGLSRMGELFTPDESKLHEFMRTNVESGDVLISSTYSAYVRWMRHPKFSAFYRIGFATPLSEITTIIQSHPSGWIAIDRSRVNELTFDPFQAFASLGLEYLGTFGENQDEYLWHWQREK